MIRHPLVREKSRWVAWVLPLLILMVCTHARGDLTDSSQGAALQWLKEMEQAVAKLSYKGVVAYLKEQQVESFQLFHSSSAGVEQERLVSMNSPLREVIRNADKVSCYFPGSKKAFVEKKPGAQSVLVDLPDDLAQLTRYYKVDLQGQEYVAGRLSQVVGIEPRDKFRYARLIWVDTSSKLPLKFELLDEEGQAVEQMVFTSVSVEESIAKADLEPSMRADSFTWQSTEREALPLGSLRWTLQSVTEGFQIVSYSRVNRPSSSNKPAEHILLSDGFSSVSIYIEAQKDSVSKEHPRKVGAINAYTVKLDGYTVTVMGEVPARTVQLIADGLKFHENRKP